MAASYQTGTASSPTNLLQTLVTWLVAHGWTQDASAADGSGHRAHLHKNGLYVNLRSAMNESNIWAIQFGTPGYGIGLYLGDGYSGAAAWNAQSGGPVSSGTASRIGVGMNLPSGSITAYHFLDDGSDHIAVLVERAPGIYTHMGWGPSLVKTGYSWDSPYFFGNGPSFYTCAPPSGGGSFSGYDVTAFCPASHSFLSTQMHSTFFVRVDSSVFSGLWVANNGDSSSTAYGNTGRQGRCALARVTSANLNELNYPSYRRIVGRGYNTAFTGAVLMPLSYFVTTGAARLAPVGYPPSVFYSEAVGNGRVAGEIVAVGGVNYLFLPNFAIRKAA